MRYDLGREPYLLYLGTLQPRKNLVRLVRAFAQAWAAFADPVTLVVAGKPGWMLDELSAEIRRLGVGGLVRFPGYIEEDDKAALLSGATAFVFPSLYEGFGLPVLEAQACGCPVITSETSSLPEVAGEGALLVDPLAESAIAAALVRIMRSVDLRLELVNRGRRNVQRFNWLDCARTILRALERAAGSDREPRAVD
jgi:glycosyltransferase involved in cell wall biosynthesis